MTIIEQIKNGAKFRHVDGTDPKEWYIFSRGYIVIDWGFSYPIGYTNSQLEGWVEIIPATTQYTK